MKPKTKTFNSKKGAASYTKKLAKKGDISKGDAKRVLKKLK